MGTFFKTALRRPAGVGFHVVGRAIASTSRQHAPLLLIRRCVCSELFWSATTCFRVGSPRKSLSSQIQGRRFDAPESPRFFAGHNRGRSRISQRNQWHLRPARCQPSRSGLYQGILELLQFIAAGYGLPIVPRQLWHPASHQSSVGGGRWAGGSLVQVQAGRSYLW